MHDSDLDLDLDLDPNRTHIATIAIMALKSTTTSRTPSSPPLGVLASPAEWRKQLESLPDGDQLGRTPSIYCEPDRAILRFLSRKVGGKAAWSYRRTLVLMTILSSPPPLFGIVNDSRTRITHPDHPGIPI